MLVESRQTSKLSESLVKLLETVALPEDVPLTVDIDPVDLV
jgi:hypothetical protein